MTAKKKTFKKSVKVKKYNIVLKDNLGKAIRNAKVTIKVGKKKFNAKTNSKGKATFKIKKLTKKGTYKATVTYKGNAYYNKVTKKVNIKLKWVQHCIYKFLLFFYNFVILCRTNFTKSSR